MCIRDRVNTDDGSCIYPDDFYNCDGSCISDIDNDGAIEFIVTSKNKNCYVINQYGDIELIYETDQYLMGSPSLANLDSDPSLL